MDRRSGMLEEVEREEVRAVAGAYAELDARCKERAYWMMQGMKFARDLREAM